MTDLKVHKTTCAPPVSDGDHFDCEQALKQPEIANSVAMLDSAVKVEQLCEALLVFRPEVRNCCFVVTILSTT